jgi:bromodomain adjacent to zinc finger domain protein 1A
MKSLSAGYLASHSVFKLDIISFLCELAVQTKVIRDRFEQSSLALSKCRNDQLAVQRDLAKMRARD